MMRSVKQVAAQLGISATCVYQLIATGKLASYRIGVGRGAIRVAESDLAAFLEASRSEELSPRPAVGERTMRREFKHLRLRK